MEYKVLLAFTDPDDGNHVYGIGGTYPRAGYEPTEERVAYLLSDKTSFQKPVIAPVKAAAKPKTKK